MVALFDDRHQQEVCRVFLFFSPHFFFFLSGRHIHLRFWEWKPGQPLQDKYPTLCIASCRAFLTLFKSPVCWSKGVSKTHGFDSANERNAFVSAFTSKHYLKERRPPSALGEKTIQRCVQRNRWAEMCHSQLLGVQRDSMELFLAI